MTSIKMKTVRFRMIRTEMWEPECQVPAHMNEDEAMEYATENYSDPMYDEYMHKYTYDQETEFSVIELDVPLGEQKDCSLVSPAWHCWAPSPPPSAPPSKTKTTGLVLQTLKRSQIRD